MEGTRGLIAEFKAAGLAQHAMAVELTALGVRTSKGTAGRSLIQVQRVLARL